VSCLTFFPSPAWNRGNPRRSAGLFILKCIHALTQAFSCADFPVALNQPCFHFPLTERLPQVRDAAETSLEREISEIEQSISKLSIQLSRLNTDISHLDVTKLRLENDLKDKREALDLEAEVEQRQRDLGQRINAAFEG